MRAFVVCGVSLQVTDSNRDVILSHLAYGLALLVLWTYTATRRREEIRLADHPCRAVDIALFDLLDECGDIHPHGACADAQWFSALQTT